MIVPAPLPPAPAAGVPGQPVPGVGPPGAPLGPGDDLDPIQMEMMLQQAMYDLMQRPIIPDTLVFICAALYLIIVMALLIAGAFYFTNRLQPPPPATPPEETETAAIYTEPPAVTTEDLRLWDKHQPGENPIFCFIGLQYKNNRALVQSLVGTCDLFVMKDNFDLSNGATTLQAYSDDEIKNIFEVEYGDKVNDINAGLMCCSLAYTFGFLDINFNGACKIKLQPNVDVNAADTYIKESDNECNSIYLEIGEATEAEVTRLAPLFKTAQFVLYAPTRMTEQALAKHRMSLLPNNFQELPKTAEDKAITAAQATVQKKVCVMFTVAAIKSSGVSKSSVNPVNQPATSVVAINQSMVCELAGLISDKPSLSYYRKGDDMASLDTPETLAKKVKAVLKVNLKVCVAAYDVQFDDCPGAAKNPLTTTIARVFKKELRRR